MLTNLLSIDCEQAENLVRFSIRTNGNIFLFGQSGVGKTTLAMDAIAASGFKTNYINLSVVERCDLMGYADMFNKEDVVKYKSPHFLPALKEGAKPTSILLLDEIDKVEQENAHPLLELLQFRSINGKKLDIAAVILTGNLPNENVGGYDISKALLGRGARYELKFDFEKWLQWARKNGIHDLILGFLQHNPKLCCSDMEHSMLAAPTPRSWEMASQAIIKAREMNMVDIETISALVAGFVGVEVGQMFRSWYEHFRRFEPVALSLVEKGIHPSEWNDWSNTEQIVFVITACNMARMKFVAASKTKPKYGCIERLCEWMSGLEPELQVMGLSNSFPMEMVVDPRWQLYKSKPFFELSQKLSSK